MPAHNKTVCTDSNGKQASKTSTAEAFPLPPFCYALPELLFLAFCIDRTGRKNNRIHNKEKTQQRKNRIKAKESKQTAKPKRQRKQAKRESVTHSNAITKRTRQRETDSTSKRACKPSCYYNTSKRDHAVINTIPRKAYKQISKEGKGKAILFPPMPI